MLGAFFVRFEGAIPARYWPQIGYLIPVAWAVKLAFFYLQGLYHINWSYVSVRELLAVGKATLYGSLLLGTLFFLLRSLPALEGLPRSILVLDFVLTLVLIGGFRSAKRVYFHYTSRFPLDGARTLIVGAGDAGEQLVRNVASSPDAPYYPVGFVDDDVAKQGTVIQGVKVLGTSESIPELVARHEIQEIVIAMPTASSERIKSVVALAREVGIPSVKILPALHEMLSGRVDLADVRDVRLEDLLGRDPVEIDTQAIESYLRGRSVLVTGAAGSIGGELCRQIAKFGPEQLVLLDHEETGLYEIHRELQGVHPELPLKAVVGDVKDDAKLRRVFERHRPSVVFHAAAYKHVGLMREHPDEAVRNNVFGTRVVAEAAIAANVATFILISTDKAVNPAGVMGMSKRVAELVVQSLNQRGPTKFSAVRFGNVLGSRGSVVPLFQEQIRQGGPVTVTDPDMKRYFMTPSEAVLLVLQAGAMGQGGEIFVLDMGEPVRILDLAQEMIRLSGYEPDRDVEIEIIGANEDEKLVEDMLTAEEGTEATKHEQIFVARLSGPGDAHLQAALRELDERIDQGADEAEIRDLLAAIIDDTRRNTPQT